MKEFFKPTKIKIGLALGILAFHVIEVIFYNINLAYNVRSTGELGEINIGLKIIHYISQIIFIPLNIIGDVLGKLGVYFFDNSYFLFDYFSVISIVFLLLTIFYCYFLSCLIFYLNLLKSRLGFFILQIQFLNL